jgi:hypothetical protein
VATDFGELVAIAQAIVDELFERIRKNLQRRPQLKLGLAVLAIIIGLLFAGKTAAWLLFTPSEISLGKVSGTVLLDGKPVSGATVEFTPDEGSTSYGITNTEGDYTLQFLPDRPGAVTGHHSVRITTYDWRTTEDGQKFEVLERVPVRYNRESTLTANVTSGSQTLNWELRSQ